jgi:hypothetical protein
MEKQKNRDGKSRRRKLKLPRVNNAVVADRAEEYVRVELA